MKVSRLSVLSVLIILSLFFIGCSSSGSEEFHEIEPGSIYSGPIEIHEPVPSGTNEIEENGILLDSSNAGQGYIMIRTTENKEARLKCRISHDSGQYTYDLSGNTVYTVYPLQMGAGTYDVAVYENVEGTSYAQIFGTSISVPDSAQDTVFVYPHQLVWYTNESPAVLLSFDICDGLTSDEDKVEAIYDYVTRYLSYDKEKAQNVQAGYIPDIEQILKDRKGICFDYSALMAAMLRAQNIPSQLVMGNLTSEGIYHAWNEVYINGEWRWYDATYGPNNENEQSAYADDRRY